MQVVHTHGVLGDVVGVVVGLAVGDAGFDADGAGDVCELIDGTQEDMDENGIPDDGEGPEGCEGNMDGTGEVDIEDLLLLMAAWDTEEADLDGDGTPDINDLLLLMSQWGPCV
ncbi:MAG: hypothetical protein QF733_09590 [Phycisphaerales bacterium]|jgi:hypothetical protein|nr:hypothetical protein [Phycisphaerales bacterium]